MKIPQCPRVLTNFYSADFYCANFYCADFYCAVTILHLDLTAPVTQCLRVPTNFYALIFILFLFLFITRVTA